MIAYILCSCLKLFYCVNVEILLLNSFECRYSIHFLIKSSILSRFRADLIFKFLNDNDILLLWNIFENDLYEELFSNSFNSSFENEIISLIFFIDWKNLIETQYIKDAKKKRTYDSKKKISTANLLMHDLIIFSASINLKNIFVNK